MSDLKLTARIWSTSPTHAMVQVFQNGGLAGELTVEAKYAEQVIAAIASAPTLLTQRDRLKAALEELWCRQHGPPLTSEKAEWRAAMDEAQAAIADVEKSDE